LLLLCAALAQPIFVGRAEISPATTTDIASHGTNAPAAFVPLSPGPNDGRIAFTATAMLEKFHFLHLKFDAEVSSKALDLYINDFDPQHIHFLQSDLAEFEQYRTELGDLIKHDRDTSPAYVIFNRFMQRLEERSAYTRQLRHDEDFDFNGTNRYSLDRKKAPFPKDLDEAHQLWRERVRYEYLTEKLNRESPMALGTFMATRHTPLQFGLAGQDFRDGIITFFDKRYTRILRNYEEWESSQVLEAYLTAVARVYDPHSDYESKNTLEDFQIQMSLSLFGIGAVLTTDDDGYCRIVSLQPGMPADKTRKLSPQDRIVEVAQGADEPVDVVQMPLTKVVRMIRGPKGTEVRLTIIPAKASDNSIRTTVSVIRDEIKLEDQQAKAKLIELPGKDSTPPQRLGVIDLPSFYASYIMSGSRAGRSEMKSANYDVLKLLQNLEKQHVDGVILDMRHNGGGLLQEAIEIAGLFIKEGPIVQIASTDPEHPDPDRPVVVDYDPDPDVQYDGPLLVLVDRFSASASEIVAGALQDYGRAVLVGGASTHGKGTVQSVSELAPFLGNPNRLEFGALKYTTNKFYRVNGSSTQLKGVVPDIILPATFDYLETEEASEEYPLKWDTIPSADFEKLNRAQPYLAELEKRSSARVAKSKDFDYVREDIGLVKKVMADKSFSLNERQRLKEAEEAEARAKAREAELKTRKPSDEKIFDLTLKDGNVEMVEEKAKPLEDANLITGSTPRVVSNSGNTNTTSIASATGTKTSGSEAEPLPEMKAGLEEAEHILSDYIALLHSQPALTAEQPAKP
jgi:carboxyl-terminal processing protease